MATGWGATPILIEQMSARAASPEPPGDPARTKRSASYRQRGSTRTKPRTGCSPNLNASPAQVMTRQFNVVVERDAEGFFVATVPSLPGCHTQARSLDQLMERVREAIELYIEVEDEPGGELDFVGVQRVCVEA